ncbi:glutamate 5-kinase [Virgibacillus salexigens]|uniref:Glutamate 5-kinase n=1 Tax=Virgibacillus massiliensis TaxID=1462526 RepID=A0A024QF11_9BACI|nr:MULTISPECIES: glutamate 5-kinase [Virgibacillus]CDQ40837.1 Glutamate 5-kinase 1 [Virgibacillus massiliensis]
MSKQRIVVKIGSSSLTNPQGELDKRKLTEHVEAIARLRQQNHDVVLVSSGAVASGFSKIGYASKPVTVKGKQAAAAVGQGLLIQTYMEKFAEFRLTAAQLLLTREDFTTRSRYKNVFNTMMELLERRVIPIINENDTVSINELTFGDNDMLSALVSGIVHADQLMMLTDINGLYNGNPRTNPDVVKYDYLEMITEEMIAAAESNGSSVGTGGMKSKLEAARMALSLGVNVFIGTGEGERKLLEIISGDGDGTYISNKSKVTVNTNRQWIALHSETMGKIYVDEGAEKAILYQGASLLSAGIQKIKGTFQEGDVVEVYGIKGLIGKGEVSCSAAIVNKEMEERNTDNSCLSSRVIHRDRWVRLK